MIVKPVSFLVFFAGIAAVCFSQDFVVSPPVSVAPGYGNYHPQLEVLGDHELGMIWTNSSTNQLYFCKRTGETTFGTPIQLNPAGTEVQDYNWSGPDLCAWSNKVYVAYHDLGYETGHIYLVTSDDYGATFGDTVRVDDLADAYAQFPDVAVYNDTLYVAYMTHGFTTMNPQMVVSRSVDGGQTFEPLVDATTWAGEEVCDCCQPEIMVDDSRIIIYYRQNATNVRDIKAVVSYDRGETFTTVYSPDDHNWYINACPSTGPDGRFLANGNPACIYKTNVGGTAKLFVNEYDLLTDNTVNLVDIYATDASNTGINYPQMAVSGSLIGIVWEGLGSGTDVFFNASDAGVTGLLPGQAINVTNVSNSQSKPDIAILNGAFHIIYSELSGAEVKYVRINAVNGIGENEQEQTVLIYPNPAQQQLTVNLTAADFESGIVEVLDISGRLISTQQISQNSGLVEVNVADLQTGVYTLRLNLDGQLITQRFVKN